MNMNKLYVFLFGALFALMACDKTENEIEADKLKNIVYEASLTTEEGDSQLILKGEYVDETGKKVAVDADLPWKLTLKNVSPSIKGGFSGYVFSIKANRIVGTISMTVTPVGSSRPIYSNKKTLNITTNSDLGFTGAELKEKTSFSFTE